MHSLKVEFNKIACFNVKLNWNRMPFLPTAGAGGLSLCPGGGSGGGGRRHEIAAHRFGSGDGTYNMKRHNGVVILYVGCC